jgi:hypothetical protein
MKSLHSHSIEIAIAIALLAIGTSLPARANEAVINNSVQNAVITGNGNTVTQSNNATIDNRSQGNRSNSGTSIDNRQNADVLGDNNRVTQTNDVRVRRSKYRND